MSDLYAPSFSRSQYSYQQQPQQFMSHSGSSNGSSEDLREPPTSPHKDHIPKPESKPQATFLTKLYSLLDRPENHHMIRWDPAGEHIIVERPEQLALHVLPSIYRQSRFASFSRQLNIYGFMRKVNLRNVDPAIDDPDASTWSHPTLNRHSAPETVANFKRRVPPRLPKPRSKRDTHESPTIPPPRSVLHSPSLPPPHKLIGRARGYSAPSAYPGSFSNLNTNGLGGNNNNWGNYPARAVPPPLTVPSENHHHSSATPPDESSQSSLYSMSAYQNSRELNYSYNDQHNGNQWAFSASSANSAASLSSLLNPSNSAFTTSRPSPTINTNNYPSPFANMPMSDHSEPMSPESNSRPTTGYSMSSVSSVSSLPYEDGRMTDYSRPSSSHYRPSSPVRSNSSKSNYNPSLSVRRSRRHSQALGPYPNPYTEQRPSTSPQPADDHESSSIPRVRSMVTLPSSQGIYGYSNSHADFAYSAGNGASSASIDSDMDGQWTQHHRAIRSSASTSSISALSNASSSQANTPPIIESYGKTDINRFSPEFAFVPLNENLPHHSYVTKQSDA